MRDEKVSRHEEQSESKPRRQTYPRRQMQSLQKRKQKLVEVQTLSNLYSSKAFLASLRQALNHYLSSRMT
jgi:uncharacterized membrane protein